VSVRHYQKNSTEVKDCEIVRILSVFQYVSAAALFEHRLRVFENKVLRRMF
jgi:hypothetical protein